MAGARGHHRRLTDDARASAHRSLLQDSTVHPGRAKVPVHAVARSRYARRDTAIALLLLDTDIRATKLCGLTMDDIDLQRN